MARWWLALQTRQESDAKQKVRKYLLRALWTTLKVIVLSVAYVVVMMFLAPVSGLIPGLGDILTTFMVVYVVLMVIGDVCSGTILQHFFNGARALFVIAYLIISLNSGIVNVSARNVSLMIDVRLFLVVVMLLGLLGLARSIMQAINFVSERVEVGAF